MRAETICTYLLAPRIPKPPENRETQTPNCLISCLPKLYPKIPNIVPWYAPALRIKSSNKAYLHVRKFLKKIERGCTLSNTEDFRRASEVSSCSEEIEH